MEEYNFSNEWNNISNHANFLTDSINKLSESFMTITHKAEEALIKYVQEETGLSRECAIKYITTYMNIKYDFDSDTAELNMISELKDITELPLGELEEKFPRECTKQLILEE